MQERMSGHWELHAEDAWIFCPLGLLSCHKYEKKYKRYRNVGPNGVARVDLSTRKKASKKQKSA
jgi:hypothetical protein